MTEPASVQDLGREELESNVRSTVDEVPVGSKTNQNATVQNQIKIKNSNDSDISSVEIDEDNVSEYSQEIDFTGDGVWDTFDDRFKKKINKRVSEASSLDELTDLIHLMKKKYMKYKKRMQLVEMRMTDHVVSNSNAMNHISDKVETIAMRQEIHSVEVKALQETMSDLVSTSVVQNRSLASLNRAKQEEKVKFENLEVHCVTIASKVEALEDHIHKHVTNNIDVDNDINIPDEPSKVTFRRKSKSPDPSTSPITDAEGSSSARESQYADFNATVDELKASIDDIKDCFKKEDRAKKKRVSISRGDDPSDSSSSSSEDSDSDNDKKGKRGKKKKSARDSSSDDDSSKESDDSDVTRGIAALNRDRRSSVFKDLEDEDEDSDRPFRSSRRNAMGSEVLTLKNLPTMKDLYLDTLAVPNLLKFSQKYQSLQQNYHEPLKIANYFKNTILNRVENVARRGRFKDKLRRKGILCNGRQRLSNSQIWGVIKRIIAPKNTEEMKAILKVSVFDREKFLQFMSESYIHEHFEEYVNEIVNYDKQFLAMLDLATGTKVAKESLPHQVNGGSGRFGQKDKGLVQYFLQGHPNPEFAWRMYTRHSKERERINLKTFDEFREIYFKGLDRLEEMIRVEKLSSSTFGKEADDTSSKVSRGIRKQNRFRRGSKHSVHAVAEDEVEKVESESEHSEVEDGESEGSADDVEAELPSSAVKSTEKADDGQEDDIGEDEWLHGMSFDPAGKRPPVCFKFADTGTCEYGTKCVYSHNVDDVKAYKAAKLLGPTRMGNISGQYSQRMSGNSKEGSNVNKSSPGVRKVFDKPTSILKRSQDARNIT